MTLDDLKHAQRERLIFLDRCLTWRGAANRRDLVERFGISAAQAALDFRLYMRLAGGAPPDYDASRKTYVAAPGHRPLAPCSATAAFGILAGSRLRDPLTTGEAGDEAAASGESGAVHASRAGA